jgi:adenylate cyclase
MNNEIWVRVHSLAGLDEVLARHDRIPFHPFTRGYDELSLGYAAVVRGELRSALDLGRTAWETFDPLGHAKGAWRAKVLLAETLTELGRADEALGTLPPVATRTELQDIVYDAPARIHTLLVSGSIDEAVEVAREIASHPEVRPYRETLGVAVEAFVAAGLLEEARSVVQAGRGDPTTVGVAGLDEAEGRLLLARGDAEGARPLLEAAVERAREDGYLLLVWRARTLLADALAAAGADERAAELIAGVVTETAAAGAGRLRGEAASVAARHGLPVPTVADVSEPAADEPQLLPAGERFVTTLFADVRDYTGLAAAAAPEDLADRIGTLQRWAAAEVGRHHGIVDKFAGDAVMATFNVSGARVDHAVHALETAFALRDKSALLDLPVGIGIAVGPAVVARAVSGANVSVLGVATNLSARLQGAARGGEIVIGDEAYRRVAGWLDERGLEPERELLELKGFAEPQVAYRIRAAAPVA